MMPKPLHPREHARQQAIARHEEIDGERIEAQRKGIAFARWEELQAAHDAIRTSHEGVANHVPCERCGTIVNLDDPKTTVFHVTGGVRRLRLKIGLDIRRFQAIDSDGTARTPWGIYVALRPPRQNEIARCESCAEHMLSYMDESWEPPPDD
jgi:hypothetical protein